MDAGLRFDNNGKAGPILVVSRDPTLCLIILGLPLGQGDDPDLLREIRSGSVVGLDLSTDDHVTKPFGLQELVAHACAVLRRHESTRLTRAPKPQGGGFRFGGWRLERASRRLLASDGTPVFLTKGEYNLLMAFLKAPQQPLRRERLLQATRVHEDIVDRSIDVQVLRLRRKLETDASAPRVIRTERGVGYVFALPVEPL